MKLEKLEAFLAAGGAISPRTGEMRTAPATSALDRSRIGRAAQHLAAFDILMRGFECSISAEQLPYDLIADINGLRRVQVKARAYATYRGPRSLQPAYDFAGLTPSKTDLFALVAMPENAIFYVAASEIAGTGYTLHPSHYSKQNADTSWVSATQQWLGSKSSSRLVRQA